MPEHTDEGPAIGHGTYEQVAHRLDRQQRKELAIAFMRLTNTTQESIAEDLGLGDGLDDFGGSNLGIEILRRVRNANKIDELREAVGAE